MRSFPFVQVDVFTNRVFGGNPLAVFTRPEGLADDEMQAIAREMNLSETTFVFPPADPAHTARVRIFTPSRELPFAGHPTLGTAWVVAGERRSGATRLVLEEGVGPIAVTLEGDPAAPDFLWLAAPEPSFGPVFDDRATFAAALGLATGDLLDTPIEVIATGVPFLIVALATAAHVDRARLDVSALLPSFAGAEPVGVFVFAPNGPNRYYSRMFAPHTAGIDEDPATGSAHGPLAAYLVKHRLARPEGGEIRALSEQGTKMGRQSFIHLRLDADGGNVRIGGGVVPVLSGTLELPDR